MQLRKGDVILIKISNHLMPFRVVEIAEYGLGCTYVDEDPDIPVYLFPFNDTCGTNVSFERLDATMLAKLRLNNVIDANIYVQLSKELERTNK